MQDGALSDIYEYLSVLGSGSYGIVSLCREVDTGHLVAIKHFLDTQTSRKALLLALREVRLLQSLDHPLVIQLERAFRTPSGRTYAVLPYIDGGCGDRILRSKFEFGLPPRMLKSFAWQLSMAVRYLHQRKVLHRDLKPPNVLLSTDGTIRLCDFGFSRRADDPRDGLCSELVGGDVHLTEYVVTRAYRAPEILLGQPYGAPADVWALGATLAEMATGRTLLPGTSSLDQLWRCLGAVRGPYTPPIKAAIDALARLDPKELGGSVTADLLKPKTLPGRPLRERLAHLEPGFVEVVEACLRLDPGDRATADSLLCMPWFADVRQVISGNPTLERLYDELYDNTAVSVSSDARIAGRVRCVASVGVRDAVADGPGPLPSWSRAIPEAAMAPCPIGQGRLGRGRARGCGSVGGASGGAGASESFSSRDTLGTADEYSSGESVWRSGTDMAQPMYLILPEEVSNLQKLPSALRPPANHTLAAHANALHAGNMAEPRARADDGNRAAAGCALPLRPTAMPPTAHTRHPAPQPRALAIQDLLLFSSLDASSAEPWVTPASVSCSAEALPVPAAAAASRQVAAAAGYVHTGAVVVGQVGCAQGLPAASISVSASQDIATAPVPAPADFEPPSTQRLGRRYHDLHPAAASTNATATTLNNPSRILTSAIALIGATLMSPIMQVVDSAVPVGQESRRCGSSVAVPADVADASAVAVAAGAPSRIVRRLRSSAATGTASTPAADAAYGTISDAACSNNKNSNNNTNNNAHLSAGLRDRSSSRLPRTQGSAVLRKHSAAASSLSSGQSSSTCAPCSSALDSLCTTSTTVYGMYVPSQDLPYVYGGGRAGSSSTCLLSGPAQLRPEQPAITEVITSNSCCSWVAAATAFAIPAATATPGAAAIAMAAWSTAPVAATASVLQRRSGKLNSGDGGVGGKGARSSLRWQVSLDGDLFRTGSTPVIPPPVMDEACTNDGESITGCDGSSAGVGDCTCPAVAQVGVELDLVGAGAGVCVGQGAAARAGAANRAQDKGNWLGRAMLRMLVCGASANNSLGN